MLNQKIEQLLKYEVIIIDSGTDNSNEIVNLFKNKAPNLFVYKKVDNCSNRSLLRNIGAELAKYELLFFLDNDMLIPSTYLQERYNFHKNNRNLIVCGRRKTLIDFNMGKIGENLLNNNFSKLDLLPWYDDERLQQNINFESWRYVYSHSLSVCKDLFYKVNGFTNEFGNVWGGEDIELSYKMFKDGASFYFMKEPAIYHQGHFSQSAKEQNNSLDSSRLFVQLHNSYNCELFMCYPTVSISKVYENCFTFLNNYYKTKSQIYPNVSELEYFDLILGFILGMNDECYAENVRLGIFLPFENKSKKNILILSSIIDFLSDIQVCILSEAIRVSDNIYFKSDIENDKIIEMFEDCGYKINIKNNNEYKKIILIDYKGNGVIQIMLPDLFSPQKRYIYLSLAGKLLEHNKRVVLREKRNSEKLNYEDYGLNDEKICKLNNCFRLQYGSISSMYLTSFSNTSKDITYLLPDFPYNFIIRDEDYITDIDIIPNKYKKSSFIDKKLYSNIAFSLVSMDIKNIKKVYDTEEQNYILTFMENGYYEDSIDMILDFFHIYKKGKNINLVIKMPNYKIQVKNAYPFHNEMSKYQKLLNCERKINNDKFLLMNKIDELKLKNNVKIIEDNLKFNEIITLISKSKYMLSLSKISNVGPEVYAGILLKKKIFIASHYYLPEELENFVIRISSKIVNAAMALDLPISSNNIHYYLFDIDKNDLLIKINNNQINVDYITENIEKKLNENFEKIFNCFIK